MLLDECSKSFHETLISDLKTGADAFGGAWLGRLAEQSEDLLGKRIGRRNLGSIGRGSQSQIRTRFRIREFHCQRPSARGGAVFGGKHQLAMMPTQVEKRIHPRIKIGTASQTVTGAAISGDAFSRMMDQGNGRAGLALQNAEAAQQCGDLAGRVFIDRMKADQGIEDEKNRPVKQRPPTFQAAGQ